MLVEVNTKKYGKLAVSSIFTENNITTFECYNELDEYLGMVHFGVNEGVCGIEVEKQLNEIRK